MSTVDNDIIAMNLALAAQILAQIPTDDLERYITECETSVHRHESFAPVLDAASYFTNRDSGRTQDAKNQNAIGRALLEARKAIDVREAYAETKRGKK